MSIDSLATYEPKGSGLYLKFKDGDEIKLRVLTLDPLVSEKVWPNTPDRVDTKYAFVVWNWNENKAQVWQVGPGLLNRFTKIHRDEDFDPLNKVDVKITATGEALERRYQVDVLPKTQTLTNDMIEEASKLKLEDLIQDAKGRLSEYSDDGEEVPTTGIEKARATADRIRSKADEGEPEADESEEVVVEDIGDEPVNLDDIPF